MGYFSDLDLINKGTDIDSSYHDFEEQLLWRYEDLKEKYSRLLRANAPVYGDDYFSKTDYRYSPIDCFNTLSDVYRAMEIAKEDLKEKCVIKISLQWVMVFIPFLAGVLRASFFLRMLGEALSGTIWLMSSMGFLVCRVSWQVLWLIL